MPSMATPHFMPTRLLSLLPSFLQGCSEQQPRLKLKVMQSVCSAHPSCDGIAQPRG